MNIQQLFYENLKEGETITVNLHNQASKAKVKGVGQEKYIEVWPVEWVGTTLVSFDEVIDAPFFHAIDNHRVERAVSKATEYGRHEIALSDVEAYIIQRWYKMYVQRRYGEIWVVTDPQFGKD